MGDDQHRSTIRCLDCGLAAEDGGAWQPPFEPHEEIRYRLDDWDPGRRLALALALYDVPFRWEPGPVLVVREEGHAVIQAFLDDVGTEGNGAGEEAAWDEQVGVSDDVASAMGELFLSADRLRRAPWDRTALERMRDLGALVQTSMPPFGIDAPVWKEIATRALDVVVAGDLDDHDGVEDGAARLRSFLRDYV